VSDIVTLGDALTWPTADKIKLLGTLRSELWNELSRPEQKEPEGDWRIWYLMGGRGSGKSRTGAETFCAWINAHPTGEWAIVAPTFADARDTCVESASSGILNILGPAVQNWNRSLGEILLVDGSKIYLDGADDGALRIQGKNLRGAWCDEVGLWNQWDRAWNESLAFAVRHEPARLVATGTPKMGHGLVKLLVEDPLVPKAQMRTSDNVGNLHPSAVRELYTKYGGTRLGSQELDGEWLEAIEGDMLKRAWWKYYDPDLIGGRGRKGIQAERLPRFQMILLSIDTPLKDKETSDFVALQAWGVIGADRYLLDTRVERLSYDQCKRAVKEMSQTMRQTFRGIQHRCLIENAGYGVELYLDLQRELGGIHKISPGSDGNKTMRALAASSDLETGNCFLPGHASADLSGPDPNRSPAWVLAFVDELALFDNGQNDDQVDAWSQAMNWLRSRSPTPMRTASALRNVRQRNPFIGTTRRGNR
jgi:predicted phage terminase large subunit-like protein